MAPIAINGIKDFPLELNVLSEYVVNHYPMYSQSKVKLYSHKELTVAVLHMWD